MKLLNKTRATVRNNRPPRRRHAHQRAAASPRGTCEPPCSQTSTSKLNTTVSSRRVADMHQRAAASPTSTSKLNLSKYGFTSRAQCVLQQLNVSLGNYS